MYRLGSPNLSALLARLRESLDVLHGREFRLLFAGQAVSVLGDRMVAVALAFAVLEIGGSATDVGLVLAAGVFPLVGSVLVGGVVADRASRRAVMVVSAVRGARWAPSSPPATSAARPRGALFLRRWAWEH